MIPYGICHTRVARVAAAEYGKWQTRAYATDDIFEVNRTAQPDTRTAE